MRCFFGCKQRELSVTYPGIRKRQRLLFGHGLGHPFVLLLAPVDGQPALVYCTVWTRASIKEEARPRRRVTPLDRRVPWSFNIPTTLLWEIEMVAKR